MAYFSATFELFRSRIWRGLVSFTMEIEKDEMFPFLGTYLLNREPQIETKVYVKPTSTGLLLHYHTHIDNRYKRSLLTTMHDARTVCPHREPIPRRSANA